MGVHFFSLDYDKWINGVSSHDSILEGAFDATAERKTC